MNNPYDLLSRCLSEVKDCRMPAIKKLKLEVQLYQLKRLVLMRELGPLGGCAPRDKDFTALHGRVRDVCRAGGQIGELDELIKDMTALGDVLAGDHAR